MATSILNKAKELQAAEEARIDALRKAREEEQARAIAVFEQRVTPTFKQLCSVLDGLRDELLAIGGIAETAVSQQAGQWAACTLGFKLPIASNPAQSRWPEFEILITAKEDLEVTMMAKGSIQPAREISRVTHVQLIQSAEDFCAKFLAKALQFAQTR